MVRFLAHRSQSVPESSLLPPRYASGRIRFSGISKVRVPSMQVLLS